MQNNIINEVATYSYSELLSKYTKLINYKIYP